MEAIVQGELEEVEQLALTASRAGKQHREEAVRTAASHASVVLATLLHVGLICSAEEIEWRERLGRALADPKRLARRTFTISRAATSHSQPPTSALQRRTQPVEISASVAWRGSTHTTATESAITDALATEANDPERIRRACELGFADRGKEEVPSHHL